jgi:hypothetical protein
MPANGPGRNLDFIRPCLRDLRSHSERQKQLGRTASKEKHFTFNVAQRGYHKTTESSHCGIVDQLDNFFCTSSGRGYYSLTLAKAKSGWSNTLEVGLGGNEEVAKRL